MALEMTDTKVATGEGTTLLAPNRLALYFGACGGNSNSAAVFVSSSPGTGRLYLCYDIGSELSISPRCVSNTETSHLCIRAKDVSVELLEDMTHASCRSIALSGIWLLNCSPPRTSRIGERRIQLVHRSPRWCLALSLCRRGIIRYSS